MDPFLIFVYCFGFNRILWEQNFDNMLNFFSKKHFAGPVQSKGQSCKLRCLTFRMGSYQLKKQNNFCNTLVIIISFKLRFTHTLNYYLIQKPCTVTIPEEKDIYEVAIDFVSPHICSRCRFAIFMNLCLLLVSFTLQ